MEPQLKPARTDNQNFRRNYAAQDVAYTSAEGRKVLRNTYLLLALTMVPTVIGAAIGMQTARIIMRGPGVCWMCRPWQTRPEN